MEKYTVRLELDTRAADPDRLLDALADYGPIVTHAPAGGRAEVTITLPADNLRQAITTALAVTAGATGYDVHGLVILPASEWLDRIDPDYHAPIPDLLSVTEAAAELHVSPQALRERLDRGTFPGKKAGSTWVVRAFDVYAAKKAAIPTAVAPSYRTES